MQIRKSDAVDAGVLSRFCGALKSPVAVIILILSSQKESWDVRDIIDAFNRYGQDSGNKPIERQVRKNSPEISVATVLKHANTLLGLGLLKLSLPIEGYKRFSLSPKGVLLVGMLFEVSACLKQ